MKLGKLISLAMVLLVVPAYSGCGNGDGHPTGTDRSRASADTHGENRGGEEGGEEEGDQALGAIAAADRRAFVQIAIAAGDLRGIAAVRAAGHPRQGRDLVVLRTLRRNVAGLASRDARLVELRSETVAALRQAIESYRRPGTDSRGTRATLAAVTRITRDLKRYETSHPAIQALVPD